MIIWCLECDFTRAFDVLLVRLSMSLVINRMNKTMFYNMEELDKALNRPKGVGLLTVCNHVSVLDSATFIPCKIPLSKQVSTQGRNS